MLDKRYQKISFHKKILGKWIYFEETIEPNKKEYKINHINIHELIYKRLIRIFTLPTLNRK